MSTSEYWERLSKKRLSRRKALAAGAVGAGAAALALTGCGGDDDSETAPTATAEGTGPKYGGDLRQASVNTALSIDPHTEIGQGLAYIPFIYGYLIHYIQYRDDPPEVEYDHALSVETPDDTTYIFKLRPGIRFHDVPPANGREVVAEDVLYSFDRLSQEGMEPFWKTRVAGRSAPDALTVQLVTTTRYAYVPEEVGLVKAAIVPREAVEAWGNLQTQGLGSGPFMFKSFSRGAITEAVRNPNYYVEGIPYLDAMTWQTISDESSIRVAFRSKQLDIYAPPSKLEADEVAEFGDDVRLNRELSLWISVLQMIELSKPELQDVRVREAIQVSLDRDAMIERLGFGEGEYCAFVSPALGFWSLPQEELRERFKRDVTKAKQLLSAAGAADLSLELKVVPATHGDAAAMVKEHLAEAGINVDLISQEIGTWRADQAARNMQLAMGGGLPYASEKYPMQFNHTANWTRNMQPTRQPEPEIDALLDKILETPDVNERKSLVQEAMRMILDRHHAFPLYAPYAYTCMWDYVKGYEDVPSAKFLFTYDMWLNK